MPTEADIDMQAEPAALGFIPGRQPDQIAFVVEDLASAVATWSAVLGSSEWRIHTYSADNVNHLEFGGKASNLSMRLAMCGEHPQIELIESLRGPNVYSEWSLRHGFGLQHIGYFVPSILDTMRQMKAAGLEAIQSGQGYGLDRDGGFAYYTIPGVDIMVEFIEVPRRRRPSESLLTTRHDSKEG
jgi:catechol 2,3-dioxygenase-like lactoylglutathione lyase family enzyme